MAEAVAVATRKKRAPAGGHLRLEVLDEGDALQVMHHGPYAEEGSTIAALHAAMTEAGLVPRGPHHEVYLSDPHRSTPAKMRTILRQPVSLAVSLSGRLRQRGGRAPSWAWPAEAI